MLLSAEQRSVVEAASCERRLVIAGPGCGKTYVACARVAHLLDRGEVPERILLLSFTRTAIHELRNRIAAMSRQGLASARGVELRTIDAFAWRLAQGTQGAAAASSYDEAIRRAEAALSAAVSGEDQELADYIRRFSHVFVDESQDLVGPRAHMVVKLLNGLAPGAGWTVFIDPAQAIYGWSSDAMDDKGGEQFLELVRRLDGKWSKVWLKEVFRTSRPELLEMMSFARHCVLKEEPGKRLGVLRERLECEAGQECVNLRNVAETVKLLGEDTQEALVLFRRRVDVLVTLGRLRDAGLTCRLRIGGLPRAVAPWIAAVANEIVVQRGSVSGADRLTFESAWQATCEGRAISRGWDPETAWELLRRTGGSRGERINLRDVASQLALALAPDEAFVREVGPGGPIIGTVHGSKGREARQVVFFISEGEEASADEFASDEEARILYVAISRATHRLKIHRTDATYCGYHEGRAWRSTGKSGLFIEMGCEGDLDAPWAVHVDRGADAFAIQSRLASFEGTLSVTHVGTELEVGSTRMLRLPDGAVIGALSENAVRAAGAIVSERSKGKARAPLSMSYVTWLGVSTVALGADHPCVEQLAFPWRETRMMLAPIIGGMAHIKRYW
jgi:hypothetical protein